MSAPGHKTGLEDVVRGLREGVDRLERLSSTVKASLRTGTLPELQAHEELIGDLRLGRDQMLRIVVVECNSAFDGASFFALQPRLYRLRDQRWVSILPSPFIRTTVLAPFASLILRAVERVEQLTTQTRNRRTTP